MHDPWEALARQAAFRSHHKVGQKVRARFLREEGGLAWVSVDGQELLARVAQMPAPGAVLLFLVKSLEPDIQLQDVTPAYSPATPLAIMAADFLTVRSHFDGLLRHTPEYPAEANPAAYRSWLMSDTARTEAFLRCAGVVGTLNRALAPHGRRLYWLPWLPMGAEAHELVVRNTGRGLLDAELGFIAPPRGMTRLRVLFKPPRAAWRLLLERPEAWNAGLKAFTASDARAEFLGLERLPPGGRGGVLAEALRGLRF